MPPPSSLMLIPHAIAFVGDWKRALWIVLAKAGTAASASTTAASRRSRRMAPILSEQSQCALAFRGRVGHEQIGALVVRVDAVHAAADRGGRHPLRVERAAQREGLL